MTGEWVIYKTNNTIIMLINNTKKIERPPFIKWQSSKLQNISESTIFYLKVMSNNNDILNKYTIIMSPHKYFMLLLIKIGISM